MLIYHNKTIYVHACVPLYGCGVSGERVKMWLAETKASHGDDV